MKKGLALLLSATMLMPSATAARATEKKTYEQPFMKNTMGSETFRIPGLITLKNGSVMATVDMRYSHTQDSPNNLDTLVAVSPDGYKNWAYTVVNHFDDYPDGVTNEASASFIDPVMIQSKTTDRIFLLCDAFPSGIGSAASVPGSGCVTVDGKKYLALFDGDNTDITKAKYYIGDFSNGFASVFALASKQKTAYTVDSEYRLYKNGEALTMKQNGTEKTVKQNVFYIESELTVFRTCFEWLRWSDDNGKTWSEPMVLNAFVKGENERFYGAGPGRGIVTTVNGKERIVFPMYWGGKTVEHFSAIYSDDGGKTWQRGENASWRNAVEKTSETQIVSLPNGGLRAYSRNAFKCIAYGDSFDGGKTWTKFQLDPQLTGKNDCMVSFLNTSKKINGKTVLLASFAGNRDSRANGVVKVGLFEADNSVTWISTYHINTGFFAYSCMTELSDGSIGILVEETEYGVVNYKILSVDENGNISEINGENAPYADSRSKKEILRDKWRDFYLRLLKLFKLA
ncbi:MAG TPA: hypothetical protein DDY98_01775 [Ruminococcaceae bacterium]|nr:hypothetical protein [Oscillospiraceae bacterium]